MNNRQELIAENLSHFRNELQGHQAKLLAVSKTKPVSDIIAAYESGQRDFGENKVQDLLEKATELQNTCPEIRWHFIGHLQSNKINQLLKTPGLCAIHSIDSLKLLNKLLTKPLSKSSSDNSSGEKIGLFLQINTSGESEKSGFESDDDIYEAVALTMQNDHFFLQGFMTIGRIRTENFEEDARECFESLVRLKENCASKFKLSHLELSMGMTQDYAIALKSGTNWIRIGSAIFGER